MPTPTPLGTMIDDILGWIDTLPMRGEGQPEDGTEPLDDGEDPADSEETGVLEMLPLEDGEETEPGKESGPEEVVNPAEETEPGKESEPEEETNPAEKTGGEQEPGPEALKEEPGEKDSESKANGLWIYGPEKMKAGSKKYFKARFDGFQPRRLSLTWSLDCDGSVARVYRNGQIWILPKTAPGTVLTLTCHAEALDADGRPWTGETTMQIEVK